MSDRRMSRYSQQQERPRRESEMLVSCQASCAMCRETRKVKLVRQRQGGGRKEKECVGSITVARYLEPLVSKSIDRT